MRREGEGEGDEDEKQMVKREKWVRVGEEVEERGGGGKVEEKYEGENILQGEREKGRRVV